MKKCPKCSIKHDKQGKFCSRKCANSRIHSKETKEKMRKSALDNIKENPNAYKTSIIKYEMIERMCECGYNFIVKENSIKKYCNKKCFIRYANMGGYREGSGRSKSGYYKGIFCGSTYELVWTIYNLDHNINFERFSGYIQSDDKKLKYYPDYIIGNCIYEMKGFHTELVDRKTELALSKGYDIVVLYKEDLQEQFEWVKENYKYKYLQELYYDFLPEYTYTCCYCSKEFISEIKKKTEIYYCTRRCSFKGNIKR